MTKQRKNFRHIAGLLACLSIFLAIIAQDISIWMKTSGTQSLVICTAFGTKNITIDKNGKTIPSTPYNNTNHCNICLMAAMVFKTPLSLGANDIAPQTISRTPSLPSTNNSAFYKDIKFAHLIRGPPAFS